MPLERHRRNRSGRVRVNDGDRARTIVDRSRALLADVRHIDLVRGLVESKRHRTSPDRHGCDQGERRTVDDEDIVVGCVYIYPSPADPDIAEVRSWVSADRAELDSLLHETVDSWLAADWPFTDVRYRTRL